MSMATSPIVLGIDPGIATVGYGVLRSSEPPLLIDFGVITTSPALTLAERLCQIQHHLGELIDTYQPDKACVEQLYFSNNQKTALDVAHGRGVILSTFANRGIPIQEITPNQVKQAMTGDGGADKRQVQMMIQKVFQLSALPQPDDAADAIAIAFASHSLPSFSSLST